MALKSGEPDVTLQVVYQRLMMSTYVSKWEQYITREELKCQSTLLPVSATHTPSWDHRLG